MSARANPSPPFRSALHGATYLAPNIPSVSIIDLWSTCRISVPSYHQDRDQYILTSTIHYSSQPAQTQLRIHPQPSILSIPMFSGIMKSSFRSISEFPKLILGFLDLIMISQKYPNQINGDQKHDWLYEFDHTWLYLISQSDPLLISNYWFCQCQNPKLQGWLERQRSV